MLTEVYVLARGAWHRVDGREDEEWTRLRTKMGAEKGHVLVMAGDRLYRVQLRGCIKSDRGWISGEGVRYRGLG